MAVRLAPHHRRRNWDGLGIFRCDLDRIGSTLPAPEAETLSLEDRRGRTAPLATRAAACRPNAHWPPLRRRRTPARALAVRRTGCCFRRHGQRHLHPAAPSARRVGALFRTSPPPSAAVRETVWSRAAALPPSAHPEDARACRPDGQPLTGGGRRGLTRSPHASSTSAFRTGDNPAFCSCYAISSAPRAIHWAACGRTGWSRPHPRLVRQHAALQPHRRHDTPRDRRGTPPSQHRTRNPAKR